MVSISAAILIMLEEAVVVKSHGKTECIIREIAVFCRTHAHLIDRHRCCHHVIS